MPRYRVSALMTISVSTIVDAESPDAAIAEARNRSPVGLCHGCATGEPTEQWVTSGELDGEPTDITAEIKR